MGTTITNPVINGPYDEPSKYFTLDDDGITDEIIEGRRRSEYFIPVPASKKAGAQLQLDNEWTAERIRPNDFVNEVRGRVDLWRKRGYAHVTPTTRRLLEYWSDSGRENRVLFAQREAVETAIYLAEAATKDSEGWMLTRPRGDQRGVQHRPPSRRSQDGDGIGQDRGHGDAHRLAGVEQERWPPGQALQASLPDRSPGRHHPRSAPGDLPEHEGNYYRERDLVPADLVPTLGTAQIVITNYHAFLPKVTKEGAGLAKATKDLLLAGRAATTDPFTETPAQVATRVSREFGLKPGELLVLNDEAHHCYRDKPNERIEEAMDADEKAETKDREDQARVPAWLLASRCSSGVCGTSTTGSTGPAPPGSGGFFAGVPVVQPAVASTFRRMAMTAEGRVR